MIKHFFCVVLLVVMGYSVMAQDAQFSQFYAAPLYLNPAFAGSTLQTRGGLNYRNQWPLIQGNFVTYSAYVDHYFDDYQSGLGLLFVRDEPGKTPDGAARFKNTSIALQYAYHLYLTDKIIFRPGFQAGIETRGVNSSGFQFADQFDPNTQNFTDPTGEQLPAPFRKTFFDMALGGLMYSKNFWAGVAAHHVTMPNTSFFDEGDEKLPIRWSVHGGYRIYFESPKDKPYRDYYLTPAFQYKRQTQNQSVDLGLYMTMEPIVFGAWYRSEYLANPESIVLLVGVSNRGFNFGYSFDYTVSEQRIATGGAHEISISMETFLGDPRKPPLNSRRIPCPKF